VGRRVMLGMIVAALSAGVGGGVAIAATQGGAHHVKVPVSPTVNAQHHCHTMPAAVAAV
jgi:hypothetical protein